METIKISVEVSVNLSENTQNFIKSLISGVANIKEVESTQKTKTKIATKKVVETTSKQQVENGEAVSAQKPQTTDSTQAVTMVKSASSSKSIEDVRKLLSQKVNDHREAIKQKLIEFGAPSVTKLDPAKYDEMFNFLESL